jgi:hypothetical protein
MSSLGEAVAWAVDAAAEKVRETFVRLLVGAWAKPVTRQTAPAGP